MARFWIVFCSFILLFGTNIMLGKSASSDVQAQGSVNLTAITWAHAVNNQTLLTEALNSPIEMIEADIVLGTLTTSSSTQFIPVMAHPPTNTSDLSLESFLNQILEFNNKNTAQFRKGVKLDFKSSEVFTGSLAILTRMWPNMTYPVWLNADIIKGPLNNTETVPVNPAIFFSGAKTLNTSVLSIGWTTLWGPSYRDGSYTAAEISEMKNAIVSNAINQTGGHEITFPVRAGIAAQSSTQLQDLMATVNRTNKCTLTIWSSSGDYVDIALLKKLILDVGVDKVYLDVPDEVSSKLDLGKSNGSTKLFSFSVLLVAFFFSYLFQQQL